MKIRFLLIAACLVSVSALAAPAANDGKVHPVAATKNAGKAVGHGFRDGARAVGHGTRNVTRSIGHAFRDTARKLRGKKK